MQRNFVTRMVGALSAFAFAAGAGAAAAQEADIVDTALGAGQFQTLAAALEAAGLVENLKGSGPYTVFAPTDEAFAKLPAGTVESLLEPANRDRLTAILTYHVVQGELPAAEVVKYDGARTINGAQLDIDAGVDGVKVNDANVTATDIMASNGIIHVIDAVVMPPAE